MPAKKKAEVEMPAESEPETEVEVPAEAAEVEGEVEAADRKKGDSIPYTWVEDGVRYLSLGAKVPTNARETANPVEVAAAFRAGEGVVLGRLASEVDEPFRRM